MSIEDAEFILRSVFTEEEKQVIPSSAFTGSGGVTIPMEEDIESYLFGNDDAQDYFSKIDSAEELTEDFRLYLCNGRIDKVTTRARGVAQCTLRKDHDHRPCDGKRLATV